MTTLQRHALISFGAFQVDIDSGELRKFGIRIKLQSQPFRALVILLARPGEVITREELQHEIWGTNTSVDFERGLASAINKLREALGDSAESPRYIETLAKRGYRFIAPVTTESPVTIETLHSAPAGTFSVPVRIANLNPEQPNSMSSAADVLLSPAPRLSHGDVSPAHTLSIRRHPMVVLLTLGCGFLGAAVLMVFWAMRTPHLVRPPRIVQLTQSNEVYAGLPNFENLPILVTDGLRVYTSTLSGGRAQISSIELSEARTQPVSVPNEISPVSIADISSDGSKLLLRSRRSRESEQPLWIVPTSGSTALRVGDVLAHDATWMPGGKSVLYAAGNELGVVQLDTGLATTLTLLPGRAFWPRWSRDGRLLRFTLVDPITHASNLWEFEASTHHLHRLQFPELGGLALCCGSWTADGKTYVFEANSPHESNIWAVGIGAHPTTTELTNGPLRYLSPLPSRDEQTIYFIGLEQPAGTRLYDRKLQSFIPAPAYLADAQRIAYSRNGDSVAWTDRDSRLWRAHSADGSGRIQLTPNDMEVFLAQWSPDGTRLVLMARKPGETWQLYVVNAEGGVPRLLLADKRNLADPDWSPDGRRLVFGREPDMMGKENGPHDLEYLDIASGSVQKLQGSDNLFSPRWSPDGRWIIALSLDQTRLALYDVERQTWKTLFSGGAADPVWSSDSKSLYFHAFAEPGSPIIRISPEGGSSEPVTDLMNLGIPAGENYFFSGVTPTGTPLIKPSIGSGNLYSVALPR
jgi:Tol biopolymer transport system component/DNA-binding winged helix-turn-helix (wHTH) protein